MKSNSPKPETKLQSVQQAYAVFRKKLVEIRRRRRQLMAEVLKKETDKKIKKLRHSITQK